MGQNYRDWHIPFYKDQLLLSEACRSLSAVKAGQDEVPLMVQLVENPKYRIPGFEIFHGAVDLQQHDYIHIILGRGLLDADEAFTIGFTMGSTNKVTTSEEKLYGLIAKYLYPEVYQFDDGAIKVFNDAIRLGYISECAQLDTFDFSQHQGRTIAEVRSLIGLEDDLILAYYAIEKKRFPESAASQRLLDQ